MTAPVVPSYDVPAGPPPTYTWGQRPPGGWLPPTTFGGWDKGENPPDVPPIVVLLYSFHIKQLQAMPGHRPHGSLERALLANLDGFNSLDYAGLLELDLQLSAHAKQIRSWLEIERKVSIPQDLKDEETEQHRQQLIKVYERLLELGRTMREFISSKILVQ